MTCHCFLVPVGRDLTSSSYTADMKWLQAYFPLWISFESELSYQFSGAMPGLIITCNQLSLRRKISGPVSQWYGQPRDFGIPIPKTLVIWASPSHISLTIWARVRVTGDAHITRVWRMGCPKRRDTHITVTPVLSVHIACVAGAKRGGSGGGGRRKASLPIPLPLSTPASQSGLHIQWKLAMTKGSGTGKICSQ